MPKPAKVVILGAGFAGLAAAKSLGRAPLEVVVVDRENHHCFQPLLYQVATAALSPADVAWPIRFMLRRQQNTDVVMAEVLAVDATARTVTTTGPKLEYDYLVVATGAQHSHFNHPEWATVAPGLKTIYDATVIRNKVLIAFKRAEIATVESDRCRLLTFVIVGGGPTGVELAGAIAEVAKQALPPDFRHADVKRSRIVLIEGGPRILPSFPEALSRYATNVLAGMGVEVLTLAPVTSCDAAGVITAGERIAAATIIWAAGVVASPAAAWLNVPHDRVGRVIVASDLSVPGLENVFVIGDAAAVQTADGRMVPGLAAAAKQMGHYVGKLIVAKTAGRNLSRSFRYHNYGQLATIGRRAALVDIAHLHLRGFVGWVFWSAAHIYFLIGLRNRLSVALSWLWQYLTFQRGARLIVGAGSRWTADANHAGQEEWLIGSPGDRPASTSCSDREAPQSHDFHATMSANTINATTLGGAR
jgi:NADH dehydrogenase